MDSVFTRRHEGLTERPQRQLLKKYWAFGLVSEVKDYGDREDEILDKYVESIAEEAEMIFDAEISRFMDISLQMWMLAEVAQPHNEIFTEPFEPDTKFELPVSNIFGLYQSFTKAKYNSYFQKTSPGLSETVKNWLTEILNTKHRCLGFQLLFPDIAETILRDEYVHSDGNSTGSEETELNKVGLVRFNGKGKFEFVRTFAEYFSADLLSRLLVKAQDCRTKYSTEEQLLLTRILIEPDYKLLRIFLNAQFTYSELSVDPLDLFTKLCVENKDCLFDGEHRTVFHVLAQENNNKILEFVLRATEQSFHSVDLTSYLAARDKYGKTALYIAAELKNVSFMQTFLHSVQFLVVNVQHEILLATIFRRVDDNIDLNIRYLLEYISMDVQFETIKSISKSIKGKWPLIRNFINAAKVGDKHDLEKCINEAGDQKNRVYLMLTTDETGNTALHLAATTGDCDMVKYLVEEKCEKDVLNQLGMTPLHIAAELGYLAVVQYLVEQGADLGLSDLNGMTPMQCAAKSGHLTVVKYLVEKGSHVNVLDKYGKSALSVAAESGHLDVVQYLVEKKILVDVVDRNGMSPLHIAVSFGKWDVAKYLVEHGSNVNVPDCNGITVLQLCVEAGKWDFVKYLIKQGANVDVIGDNNTTILQHFIKSNQWSLVTYIMAEKALLTLEHKKMTFEEITSNDGEDIDESDALYKIVRFGSVDLLEFFIREKDLGESLETILGKTYEELKLKNVPLTQEMEFAVEQKLVNLRFTSEKNAGNAQEVCFDDVVKRIEMTCAHIKDLQGKYSGKEVDAEFVLTARFIAQNIHRLKRQLKTTYQILPWEEIEFCLVNFISSVLKPQETDIIYKMVLDKNRLLGHLDCFAKELTTSVSEKRICVSSKGKLSGRNAIIKSIISANPEFEELYSDYELVKDVFSLNRIEFYIKLASSIDLNENEVVGKLVIERTLQVIGENFKNTPESPNLSDSIHKLLLYSAPRNVKDIITSLRDSLSHVHTLTKKIDLEDRQDLKFFQTIQSDLTKIGVEITDILFQKKTDAIKVFFNKIVRSNNIEEMKNLINGLHGTELEETDVTSHNMYSLHKIRDAMNEIENQILEKTEEEKDLFQRITTILQDQEEKLINAEKLYLKGISKINSYIHVINHGDDLKMIRNLFNHILSNISSSVEHRDLKDVVPILTEIHNGAKSRLQEKALKKINRMVHKIFCIIELDVGRVKKIDEFKEILEKKELESKDVREEKLESIFNKIEKKLESVQDKSTLREELHSKKQIHNAKLKLIDIFDEKNDKFIDMEIVEKLIKTLQLKPKSEEDLRSNYEANDFKGCKTIIIKKIDDYGNLLKNLGDFNLFSPEKYMNTLKGFFKTLKLTKIKTKVDKAINELIEENEERIKSYFGQRLTILKQIITNNGHDWKRIQEDNALRTAVEMLALDLTEILENVALFGENKSFLDEYSPVLIGKSLRNYLAHENALVDTLPFDPSIAIMSNALEFITKGEDLVVERDVLIGRGLGFSHSNLQDRYNQSLNLVINQNEMFVAAKEGNVQKVRDYISKGSDVRGRDVNGWTGLEFAVAGDSLEVFKFFLEQDLNISVKDIYSFGLVHIAATHGSVNMMEYFIKEKGWSVNNSNAMKKTLLHSASQNGCDDVVKVLLTHGADVNAATSDKFTALHLAAQNGHKGVTEVLLKKGAEVNATNKGKFTALHLATRNGYKDTAEILLEYDADVNAKANENWTPLHTVAESGHCAVVNVLLKNGAQVDALTIDNGTSLYLAVQNGYKDIVQLLLNEGADINIVPKDHSSTLLHVAAQNGHKDVVEVLLQRGGDINAVNENKFSILHVAAMNGFCDIVHLLLRNGIGVNTANMENATALHLAAQNGHKDAVECLLEYEADAHALTVDKYTPLYLASRNGYKEVIQALLEYNIDVNIKNKEDISPLHIAAQNGHEDVVDILITNGANIDITGKYNWTPLFLSAKKGHVRVLQVLLKQGADCNIGDKEHFMPLHVATYYGHKEIVHSLLDHGVDINAVNVSNMTALHIAAQNGHNDIVKCLLEQKAGVNVVSVNMFTALHFAAQNGHKGVVECLLQHKVDINVETIYGFTVLHIAAQYGHSDVVEYLLQHKADANAVTVDSTTPLYSAAKGGHEDVVESLLKHSANIHAVDKDNTTALHIASQKGHLNVVHNLLNYGANVNAVTNTSHLRALYLASRNGHKDIVEVLLMKGAEVNSRDAEGITALHIGARYGHKDIVQMLLKHSADVNAQAEYKTTALYFAAQSGHGEIVRNLLKNGADVNLGDKNGLTPLYVASKYGDVSIVGSLLSQGARVNAVTVGDYTALHVATLNGHKDVVIHLLENGADVNAVTAFTAGHITALHLAAQQGHAEILDVLLKKGGNYYIADSTEYTPLHTAASHGHKGVVELLIKYGIDVNVAGVDKFTALHVASQYGSRDIVEVLLMNGAHLDIAEDNYTPLYLAKQNGHDDVVECLLYHIANIDSITVINK